MGLTVGAHLGSHEITGLLGKGGMGEVYRARDLKLTREVALKILPEEFSEDADRVGRFQREAKMLAALNHPNIAIIHGLEESGGQQFLVMELVNGETLAEKLARGPLPIDEALRIAMQIAEALEAAHEKSIIHRDLKPANIKITPDAKIKVLDFGLAKAFDGGASSVSLSNSPTLTNAGGTGAGVILGTAAYMSPEQAKGFAVDQRSDVFSFGCILYEMLTGKQAFDGDSVSEILASVLKTEPDFQPLPPALHPRLRELLQRTLAKNPKRRIHAMADVRFEIESIISLPPIAAQSDGSTAQGSRLAWIIATIAVMAFGSLAVMFFRQKPLEAPEMRLEIDRPSTPVPLEFALAPNGSYIAFIASGDGPQRLWLRALDKTEARVLEGTEGAGFPFWSPDSRSIGFFAGGKLKRIDIAAGSPQVLASTTVAFGGAWSADGTILFASTSGPLFRISASGGDPTAVTRRTQSQVQHRFPNFLPDNRHFLFYAGGAPEETGIYLASLDGGDAKRLTAADSTGVYLPPDMIAFGHGTALMVRHLDLKRQELTGEEIRLADFVQAGIIGLVSLSVSNDGRMAYSSGVTAANQLKWYDRAGKGLGTLGDAENNPLLYPELSPDERQVAVTRNILGNADIWLRDLIRGGITRLTTSPLLDVAPVWSPDGRIVFASNRNGPYNLYIKPSTGAGTEELLLASQNTLYPQDWSKDGQFLLYSEVDPKTSRDLLALKMTGTDRTPIVIAKTTFDELNGQFSPDRHLVAYQTNESGDFQIAVQPFPEPTAKWTVSTAGGTEPRWRADGKELYFIAPDGKMMSVSITMHGSTLTAGTPEQLFPALQVAGLGANKQEYAVSKDGRFLVVQPAMPSANVPITMILNWHPKP